MVWPLYRKGKIKMKYGSLTKVLMNDNTVKYIACQKYEEYVLSSPFLMSKIMELDGKILGCFCKPDPCHGDILIKIINRIKQDKNLEF